MKLSTLFVNAQNLSRLLGLKIKRVIKYTFLKGVISVVYLIGNTVCSTFVSLKQAQMSAVSFRKMGAKAVKVLSWNSMNTSYSALVKGSTDNYFVNLDAKMKCTCEDYNNFQDIKNFSCKHVYALLNVYGFDSLTAYVESQG